MRRRPTAGVSTPRDSLPRDRDVQSPGPSFDHVQRQNAILRQIVAIHDRLSGLVLQGADTCAITAMLGEVIGRRVLVLDALFEPVERSGEREPVGESEGWAPTREYAARVLQSFADDRRPLRLPAIPSLGVDAACVAAPIVSGDDTLGYLVVLDVVQDRADPRRDLPADGEVDVLVAQHAATVYALAMMRERMASEVSRQLRNELLDGLLMGHLLDPEEVARRARRIGIAPAIPHHVLLFSAEELSTPSAGSGADARRSAHRWRRLLESLGAFVERAAPQALVASRPEGLVAIVPSDSGRGHDPRSLGQSAVLHATTLFPSWSLTVGLGGPAREATDLAPAFAQAHHAVKAARRFGRGGEVVAFADLGLHRLLFQIGDQDELDRFAEHVLGSLISYDARHRAGLVSTLDAFLRNNASPQATARELTIHVNTVSYRLQRIRSVSQLDLDDAEDRLLAAVALKILAGLSPPLAEPMPGLGARGARGGLSGAQSLDAPARAAGDLR
ncbi:MAG: helix-turn-helix domain-containing protein [Chloroflexota bacterium]